MEHFPDDVLIDIFLKLPVISLLLSKSVCKRWLRIIQNPNFISLHLNHPTGHNPLLILRTLRYYNDETEKIVLTMRSYVETQYHDKDMPLKLLSPSMASRNCPDFDVRLIGPCNGLFCITDTVDLVSFKPATRQFRNVSHNSHLVHPNKVSYHVDGIDYFDDVGFGFDPISNDYKVVRFVKFDDDDEDDDNDDDKDDDNDDDDCEVHFEVEIYSLSTKSWRELECVVPPYYVVRLCSYSLFCNGAFHWLAGDCEDDNDEGDICHILVFDLNKEAFKWFQMPVICTHDDNLHVDLSVLDESLTVIVHLEHESLHYFQIWSMMKYGDNSSWKKLYNLNDVIEVNRPLSLSNKGEFFLETIDRDLVSIDLTDVVERPLPFSSKWELSLEMLGGQLASNNLRTAEFEYHFVEFSHSLHAFRYRESLVSLN